MGVSYRPIDLHGATRVVSGAPLLRISTCCGEPTKSALAEWGDGAHRFRLRYIARVLTSEEAVELITIGHELRAFELKSPGDLADKAYCARVARAVMAMANIRDGGVVCLGIDEARAVDMLPGLDTAQLAAWSDHDNVSDALARYSEPPADFRLHHLRLPNGADVVMIDVEEFETVPLICCRDYPDVLRKGAVYVRPRGKPQSVPVPSSGDMRELLDLATSKGVRRLVQNLTDANLGHVLELNSSDTGQFRAEARDAWVATNDVLDELLSRGHFDVSIQPYEFQSDRVSLPELERLVERNVVRLRGWPLPYIDRRVPVARFETWIGQDCPRFMTHLEAWRACTSGQILLRSVFRNDLSEDEQGGSESSQTVVVAEVLVYVIEVFEFAARIASSMDLASVRVEIALVGVDGRVLVSGDWARELDRAYTTSAVQVSARRELGTPELLRDATANGVEMARVLFGKFGLDVSAQVLTEWAEQLRRS